VRAPDARRRPGTQPPARGQHLLRSDAIASELVGQAGIRSNELVLEIGPGLGRLTAQLARSAGHVIAVEIDERYAARLRSRFEPSTTVEIVAADALEVPLPSRPFRVVANLPFGATTPILRRLLDDPRPALTAADVVVEWNVARKRASPRPSNLVSLGWQPWWTFELVRHLPAGTFEPRPSVDAGFLAIRRRERPLLGTGQRPVFRALLARAFRKANLPVARSLRDAVPARALSSCLRDRGLAPGVRPTDLDVFDWVALFRVAQEAGAQKNSRAMPSGSRKLRPEP
jgi:23S rRNA (adenine-N6)-dimethyltransferase